MTLDALAPTFTAARYAKGKIAVHCLRDGSGYKTRAMRIAAAVSGRWSNREKAYIVSLGAAKRIKDAYEAGKDADLGDVRSTLGWILK